MKVNRYSASGTTHSSGIGATLALRFAETATSKPEAHPDSNIHSTIRHTVGAAALALATGSATSATCEFVCLLFTYARPMHSAANATNSALHPNASVREVNAGSSNSGKLSNANSEPALDQANSQYGGSLP